MFARASSQCRTPQEQAEHHTLCSPTKEPQKLNKRKTVATAKNSTAARIVAYGRRRDCPRRGNFMIGRSRRRPPLREVSRASGCGNGQVVSGVAFALGVA